MIRAAEKMVARGKLEAAIKQYRKVLSATPDDTGTLNRLGDLYARLDRLDEAVEIFSKAADHFVHEGFLVKAIAIFKKIIRLDPTRIAIYETLADLYYRQGLRNEARSQYQVVGDYYQQAGDLGKVRAILERMVDIEPGNPSHRVKLAEHYCDAGQLPEAMDQYQRIAAFMLDHDRVEEALRVYRGAFALSPTDLGFLTDVALHLVDRGHPDAANRLVDEAVQRNPDAARVREVTGLISQQEAPVESPAEAAVEEAPVEEAGPLPETWEEHPAELPEMEGVAEVAAGTDEPAEVVESEAAPVGEEMTELPALEIDESIQSVEDERIAAPVEDGPDPAAAPVVEEAEPADEDVVILDLESGAGDLPFAADAAESVLPHMPEEEPALELEIDLEEIEGDVSVEAAALAEEAVAEEVEEAAEAEFAEPELPEVEAVTEEEEEVAVEEAVAEEVEEIAEAEIVAAELPEVEVVTAEEEEVAVEEVVAAEVEEASEIEVPAVAEEPVEITEAEVAADLAELVEAPAVEGELEPELAVAEEPGEESEEVLEVEVGAGAEDLVEAVELEPPEEIVAEKAVLEEIELPAGLAEEGDLEAPPVDAFEEPTADELMTEAQVLVSYGLENKAAELCQRALALDPQVGEGWSLLFDIQHDGEQTAAAAETASRALDQLGETAGQWVEIREKLLDRGYRIAGSRIEPPRAPEPLIAEMIELEPPVVEPAAVESASPGWLDEQSLAEQSFADQEGIFGDEDEFFDLAAELEQELEREEEELSGEFVPQLEEQSLEEIVEGFKKGVAEKLSEEDYETHYNLGIAYREMGLLDEAIGEFQLAAKTQTYLVDCCSMLGACFLEKGFPDLAIKWFERGLEAEGVTENESLGLLYELGNLYLITGDKDVARKTFADIYGVNSNYRDVVAKLEELKAT